MNRLDQWCQGVADTLTLRLVYQATQYLLEPGMLDPRDNVLPTVSLQQALRYLFLLRGIELFTDNLAKVFGIGG